MFAIAAEAQPDPPNVVVELRSYRTNLPLGDAHFWVYDVFDTLMADSDGHYEFDLPDGTHDLWIASSGYCDSMRTVVISDSTPVSFNLNLLDPQFSASVASVTVGTWPGHDVTIDFWIGNVDGECDLTYAVSDTSAWLSVSPEFGRIVLDSTQTINAFMDADYLQYPGQELQSVLRIEHGAANSPYIIPVTFALWIDPPGAAGGPSDISPASFSLSACPNPFNPIAMLSFSLPRSETASLAVYDLTGRLAATLANERFQAGEHSVAFNGAGLPSGIYFARLSAGSVQKTQKLVLLK